MAGTADNYVTTNVAIGPCRVYANLGGTAGQWDGAAGARLILHTDGSPDSTQNPNAKHLGMTEGGCEWLVKTSFLNFNADEFVDPIITRVDAEEKVISGTMLQIMDMDLAKILMPTATRHDLGGTQGMTFGVGTLAYTSVAAIWAIEGSASPVVYGVFHLYKAFNDPGLAAQISRKKLSGTPFAFRGLAITTRATTDQSGRFFKQTAGAAS